MQIEQIGQNFSYDRRTPEKTVLYQAILENVNTVFQNFDREGRELPSHIRSEFDKYLDCGILANGFLRARCTACGHEKLIAFSCKCRGFCPSCGGRRMAEGAAHLVANIIPEVPIRQWVLSFPYNLRYLFAYQKKALHRSLQVMLRVINRHYINKGEEQHGFKGKTGAITLIQRFGGHLNLNPHFHVIFLDGIFDENGKFFKVRPPKDEEIGEVVLKIKDRVFRSLEKKEWIEGYNINFESDNLQDESPLLSDILLASIQNRLYFGTDKGNKAVQMGKIGTGGWVELKGNLCAYKDGFCLRAILALALRAPAATCFTFL
ncbi:MAG: transposase zinc-binding domain-containing protein [Deltaproteobacteria bacterium]|nr:transposase zinc-binding domain-containing protein [Deltaproteobacteria bacterium]